VSSAASGRTPIQEILLVAGYEIRALLRGPRALLILVVYGLATFAMGSAYVWVSDGIREKVTEQLSSLSESERAAVLENDEIRRNVLEQLGPMFERLGGAPLVKALEQDELPWIVLFVLLLSSFVIPGLLLVAGYDRIAEDLSTKYSRFVLQRLRRGTYLLGKYAGLLAVSFGVVVVVHCGLLVVGATRADLDLGAMASALPRIWLGMFMFLAAYCGFVALVSTAASSPFGALAGGGMALIVLWFASTFSDVVRVIWIGSNDAQLWVTDPQTLAMFAVYAAGFVGLAYARLRTKDL